MSDTIAIISDIHANREALTAALECILDMDPAHVVCLGDIVGYGPEPEWCVDAVRGACDITVCGNHEIALIYGAKNFTQAAVRSLTAHRQRLMPAPESASENDERWGFLKQMSAREQIGDLLFVHGSPANPVYEYLRERDVRLQAYKKLARNFGHVPRMAFHGHTHVPGIITGDYSFWRPGDGEDTFVAEPGMKLIVNCGSVGAPRDGDPRACFVTIEDNSIRFHRLRYDTATTIEKIRSDENCDQALAAMLSGDDHPGEDRMIL